MKKVSQSRFIKILSRYLNILEPTQKVREKQKKSSLKGECQNNNRVVACPFFRSHTSGNASVCECKCKCKCDNCSPKQLFPVSTTFPSVSIIMALMFALSVYLCVYEKLNYNYNLNE